MSLKTKWVIYKDLSSMLGIENNRKNHPILIEEKTLEELEIMGIKGRMLKFIKELISERWIKVKVGGATSHNKQTDLGVPQGGVLSVTLFLVAISIG